MIPKTTVFFAAFLLFAKTILASASDEDYHLGIVDIQQDDPEYDYEGSDDGCYLPDEYYENDENEGGFDDFVVETKQWTTSDMIKDIAADNTLRSQDYIQAGLHIDCPCIDLQTGNIYDPIWFAVRHKSHGWMRKLLSTGEFNVNSENLADSTYLLHLAVSLDDSKSVQLLLEYGADPMLVNFYGHSPLEMSLVKRTTDMFEMLLDHSDFVSVSCCFKALRNDRALELLLDSGKIPDINGQDVSGNSLLYSAIEKGVCVRRLRQIISYPGFDINASCGNNGLTALHLAANQGNLVAVKLLLENKAKLLKDHIGATPIEHVRKGNLVHKYLLKAQNEYRRLEKYMLLLCNNHEFGNSPLGIFPEDVLMIISKNLIELDNSKPDVWNRFSERMEKLMYIKHAVDADAKADLISSKLVGIIASRFGKLEACRFALDWDELVHSTIKDVKDLVEDENYVIEHIEYVLLD